MYVILTVSSIHRAEELAEEWKKSRETLRDRSPDWKGAVHSDSIRRRTSRHDACKKKETLQGTDRSTL